MEIPTNSALCTAAFFRGLPIAALAAASTLAVVSGDLRLVFASSFAVNYWWVGNTVATNGGRVGWFDCQRIIFSLGGACGSVLMVWLLR